MSSETGLEGVIVVSPVQGGPSKQGVADSRPLANTAFVVRQEQRVVGSFTTNEHGRFHISLPAGHYMVATRDRLGKGGDYGPFEVELVAGQIKKVQWTCDSGIR